MKKIEIKTTQNVVLQYELADLRDRILAFMIDFTIMFFCLGILTTFVASIFTGTALNVMLILAWCVFMFYSLGFEVLNHGQSPGKMAMRIQVIKATSGNASFADYFARWVFRLVDIYFSFGGIASVLVASSSKSQRIGDIVANTAVIKLTPKLNLELKDILAIHTQNDYRPEFPLARQLQEHDVLLIKTTIDRHRKYDNDAHREALNLLATKIAELLRIESVHDPRKFLETVLKDYVMLTR